MDKKLSAMAAPYGGLKTADHNCPTSRNLIWINGRIRFV